MAAGAGLSHVQRPLVFGYLELRTAVGVIGIALPFILSFGKMLLQWSWGVQGSISSYYYSPMRDVLVGSLCAIGVFLLSCKGYDIKDAIAGHLACIFAVGVALFPMGTGWVHYTSAALLFLTLAYFCLFLFTKTSAQKTTRRKTYRNRVYRVCGYTILVCIALIAVVNNVAQLAKLLASFAPVFCLESLAVFAFGFAWLTKGEAILADEKPKRPPQP